MMYDIYLFIYLLVDFTKLQLIMNLIVLAEELWYIYIGRSLVF